MKLTLDFGKEGLVVEVPDVNVDRVLSIHATEAHPDPAAAVAEALLDPIGSRPLTEVARGRRNAVIVVCDVTRPVPTPIILPEVLRALAEAGMSPGDVTILVATGTHRPNEGSELERMLGPSASGCRVVNNVCTDDDAFEFLGVTENDVPMKLNKTYLEADLKITIGMIEPHYMAGYAGGRKMVMPGIAALETIQAWHSPRFLEHPNATMGVTQGNPVHEESLRIARLARADFIVDVALNAHKQMSAVFAGDMEKAWEAGVRYVAQNVYDYVDEPVDIVITTAGGHPLDLTFYQSVKGMVGALPILKQGGTVILASKMEEGVGLEHFKQALLATDDILGFPERIQQPGWTFVGDQWQIEELAKAVRHAKVLVKTEGIPSELMARLFVTPIDSVEEGISLALAEHGADARIAVIPKGPYVIPAVRELEVA